MIAGIFVVLTIALISVVIAVLWIVDGLQDAWAGAAGFMQGVEIYWIFGFIAGALLLAKLWGWITGQGFTTTIIGFLNVCLLAGAFWFGVIPLINSTTWNAEFKCKRSGECNINDECVSPFGGQADSSIRVNDEYVFDLDDKWRGGFCVTPFRDVEEDTDKWFIGKAEFTQAGFRAWLARTEIEKCYSTKVERRREACMKGLDERVQERFTAQISRARCQYPEADDTIESAIFVNDDAPMVCLTRKEAGRICADMGGRLPTTDDYDWMLDERDFSCKNTVMSGLDQFTGHNRKLKARQIAGMSEGPGCGMGKFRMACDKARNGNTSDGLCDVWGNVAEWTSDGGAMGGSFLSTVENILDRREDDSATSWIGFRCVLPAAAIE